ncbi:C39 family peptidase [Bacillus sp. S/N-304-OC-R1]|uniref:C39 family peptidase n=1 Tax=Bacillus sp. S/N-304-OC-R1 TaxID=2758034 RepID=UPI001C8D0D14|nr:C39 family peptidase [Bacillus sp. S/N-304-OC-R1]MBY0121236.1 C39 family peptidase [Bacillus sp. S/N-304-OC-R1]
MKKIVVGTTFIVLVFVVYLTMNMVNNHSRVSSKVNSEVDFTGIDSITKLNVPTYVKKYDWTKEGQLKITEVFIPVKMVKQLPELPHGCEITSLTAILNTYGFEVSKTEMADKYLPKQPFSSKNNRRYGANPLKAYAGNPRSQTGGFFSYAPPIIQAAEKYSVAAGAELQTKDISGSSREEIINQLNKGIPVVIWVTLDLGKPRLNYSWYLNDTGEKFTAPVNLHAVVLNGYDEKSVHVMNPLKGQMTYNIDAFFKSYQELGSHAMTVVKNEK